MGRYFHEIVEGSSKYNFHGFYPSRLVLLPYTAICTATMNISTADHMVEIFMVLNLRTKQQNDQLYTQFSFVHVHSHPMHTLHTYTRVLYFPLHFLVT